MTISWLRATKSVSFQAYRRCCHLLNCQISAPGYVRTAVKSADTWKYEPAMDRLIGTYSPIPNVHAFLTVTRSHTLRLCYQPINAPWNHVSVPLTPYSSLDEMLTHASFAPLKGKTSSNCPSWHWYLIALDDSMLLATLDFSFTLRTYEIKVNWNIPPDVRGPQLANLHLQPSLQVSCRKIQQTFLPSLSNLPGQTVKPAQILCHMARIDETEAVGKLPLICAAFTVSSPPHSQPTVPMQSSKFFACELVETTESLHQSFKSLTKDNSKSASSLTRVGLITLYD